MDYAKKIEELYMELNEDACREDMHTTVSFKVKVETANMLSAIAEHFEQKRSTFGGEILDDACLEMFYLLQQNDAKELALLADDSASKFLKEKGITIKQHDHTGSEKEGTRYWQQKHYFKHEYLSSLEDKK